jgi:hypothetical protein
MDSLNGRVETKEEVISELEDIIIKITPSE